MGAHSHGLYARGCVLNSGPKRSFVHQRNVLAPGGALLVSVRRIQARLGSDVLDLFPANEFHKKIVRERSTIYDIMVSCAGRA